ncbi:unnamed protein product [Ixodes persulcatus]
MDTITSHITLSMHCQMQVRHQPHSIYKQLNCALE